jgi:uncharacterized membrane protein
MAKWIVHLVQNYILNPPIKLLFALGIAPPGYALLETIGWNAINSCVLIDLPILRRRKIRCQ